MPQDKLYQLPRKGVQPKAGGRPPDGVRFPVRLATLTAVLSLFLVPTASWLAGFDGTQVMVAALSILPILILSSPYLLQRRPDPLQPLSFILLLAFIGVTFQGFFLAGYFGSVNVSEFLVGEQIAILIPALIIINAGLAALVAGYLIQVKPWHVPNLFGVRTDIWSPARMHLIVVAYTFTGVISIILFVRAIGIEAFIQDFSAKRRIIVPGAAYQYASLGYHHWGALLIGIAFLLVLVDSLRRFQKASIPMARRVHLVILFLLAMVLPIISSERTPAFLLLVFSLLIVHYVYRRASVGFLATAALIGLVLLLVLGASREVTTAEATGNYLGERSLEDVAGSRNGLSLGKTAVIIHSVPEKVPFAHGETMYGWIFAPIPRTVWLDKPHARPDVIIGQEIFETGFEESGIPPGLIGELYLNFGFVGVIGGMFLLGLALKSLYSSFAAMPPDSNSVLVYVPLAVLMSYLLIGGAISGVVVFTFQYLIPLLLALAVIHVGDSAPRVVSPQNFRTGGQAPK